MKTRRHLMKPLPNRRLSTFARSGFTLMEMMIGLVIGIIVMGMYISLLVFYGRTMAGMGNYDDLNRTSRLALDVMTRDIRQSQSLISYSSNATGEQLVFSNLAGTLPQTFSYIYANHTGANGTLTRQYGGFNTLLLSNINTLTFDLTQRNPSNNFTFYTAGTNTANTKLIDINWVCSIRVGGMTVDNSEDIQTAKVVIRN